MSRAGCTGDESDCVIALSRSRPATSFWRRDATPSFALRRAGHGLGELLQRGLEVAVDRNLGRAMLAEVVDVDIDEAGVVCEHRRLAEVEAEAEHGAGHHHQGGPRANLASGPGGGTAHAMPEQAP